MPLSHAYYSYFYKVFTLKFTPAFTPAPPVYSTVCETGNYLYQPVTNRLTQEMISRTPSKDWSIKKWCDISVRGCQSVYCHYTVRKKFKISTRYYLIFYFLTNESVRLRQYNAFYFEQSHIVFNSFFFLFSSHRLRKYRWLATRDNSKIPLDKLPPIGRAQNECSQIR